MGLRIVQVDAFTDTPFAGNPAAVCLLTEPRNERWMQSVAREMNLSETAFLRPRAEGFELRWFTPAAEVDLCGHATLASAHVLWEEGHLPLDEQAHFHTRSGLLTAERRGEWIEPDFPAEPAERRGEWIELNFPAEPAESAEPPPELLQALAVTPRYVGRNRFDYLVEIESEAELRALKPDLSVLSAVPTRGVIVTSRAASPAFDFVSRFFAPRVGIDEDPVTGSAHCCLGPYWASRLHQQTFVAHQASPRGGIVRVRLSGPRVHLGGTAVTVLRGELCC